MSPNRRTAQGLQLQGKLNRDSQELFILVTSVLLKAF